MTDLFINPATKSHIDAMAKKLPQSMLLSGDSGVGLLTIAKYIATGASLTTIVVLPEKDDVIDLAKGIISVKMIRQIYDNTRSKLTKGQIIIIDFAEKMSPPAQNAFLKLLEEPNDSTYFILLSHSYSKLLPTILSRVENINISKITSKQTDDMLDKLNITDSKKRLQFKFMADGLPAEIMRLVNDNRYFEERSQNISEAKLLIQGSDYQKLLITQKCKDDRELTLRLLGDAAKIINISLINNPKDDLFKMLDKILRANEKINANSNIRLTLAENLV